MMNRGRLFLSAAAAALIYGALPSAVYAADLGGGCCGDLEERVAELEATTARKGNRVVSLQVSGQVNRALLIWDDGVDSDAYIVDPDSDGSRFRFTGKAQIKPGWTAGYIMEFNVTDSASNIVDQFNDEGFGNQASFNIRQNGWYIESERLGRLSMGQLSQPTDGINEISVVNTYATVAKTHYAGGFFLRNNDETFSGVRWQDILGAIGGSQDDIIRYDTPSFYGFILSASWGDNDLWDVALHYEKEWNSIKIAAGIGYLDDQTDNLFISEDGAFVRSGNHQQLSGSISAMHVPTGLFLTFAAGEREFDENDLGNAENWYVQGGISRNWFSYGATTLWADYARFDGFGEGFVFNINGNGVNLPNNVVGNDTLVSSESNVWGFGVVQSFDSAALNVYALAQFFSADLRADLDGGAIATDVSPEDAWRVVIGSHIKF
jgi:hypothetical protein